MRFPFFATNRSLDEVSEVNDSVHRDLTSGVVVLNERQQDLKQKVLVLEGEINKLKGDEKRGRQKKGN